MSYYDMFRQYIRNSGLSHREISRKCREEGTPVSQAYISQLVKGDVPPASDEVNRAIATVTNGDPDELIIAGYKEKAPAKIRELIEQADNVNVLVDKYIDALVDAMSDENGLIDQLYRDLLVMSVKTDGIDLGGDEGFLLLYADQTKEFLKSLDIEAKLQIFHLVMESSLASAKNEYTLHTADPRYVAEKQTAHFERNLFRVPVLSHIEAHQPVFANEHISSWASIANPGRYKEGELFFLTVRDDSMLGSRIMSGDTVLVQLRSEVENGEIAVLNVDGSDAVLRRIMHAPDGVHAILYPDNPKYESQVVSWQDVRICGIVLRVTFELSHKQRQSFE